MLFTFKSDTKIISVEKLRTNPLISATAAALIYLLLCRAQNLFLVPSYVFVVITACFFCCCHFLCFCSWGIFIAKNTQIYLFNIFALVVDLFLFSYSFFVKQTSLVYIFIQYIYKKQMKISRLFCKQILEKKYDSTLMSVVVFSFLKGYLSI